MVCDNLLGDFCYLHRLNHAKAWQPPFLGLLIAQWANVWRQMYRSTHDLEMLELLWFMSIVHCLIQLPTSRRSLHIFCSGRSWWKPKAPMINDGKFMKRNKYVICICHMHILLVIFWPMPNFTSWHIYYFLSHGSLV